MQNTQSTGTGAGLEGEGGNGAGRTGSVVRDAKNAIGEAAEGLKARAAGAMDERKGTVIAQVSVFVSVDAFHAWRDSELHRAAVAHLREVADWLIADWEAS